MNDAATDPAASSPNAVASSSAPMPQTSSLSQDTDAPQLYAGIDVGTNSVKMIIADLANGRAVRVWESSVTTRLGEGMQPFAPRLREAAIQRTLDAIDEFASTARAHNVQGIAAVGTAALRDAENRDELLLRARENSDIEVEVIPGEEEARLSYLAVRRDPQWRGHSRLLVIDIGGGSTELIVGKPDSEEIASRVSVNLGAVKLTEGWLKSDPVTGHQVDAARETARVAFAAAPVATEPEGDPNAISICGVGGTLTNLAAMALNGDKTPERLHGYALSSEHVEKLIAQLASRTVAQRLELPGLDPRRADIILGGAILLSQALSRIGSPTVEVSTRGLRWGLLYDRFVPR